MKTLEPIVNIAKKIGLTEDDLELYGAYMAKVRLNVLEKYKNKKDGKLIVVTAMTPTSAGEGKTTTTIGLTQALVRLGKRAMLAVREPSLGPVFGIKGGGTGGGKSTLEPMEEINLHFTGDFPAVTAAHNLLSAMINNHIYFKKAPRLDVKKLKWKRTLDMNDRSLRHVIVGLGEKNGATVEDGFDITPASEIMAILALSENYSDLKTRLNHILVGFGEDKAPIFAQDIKASGAMAALLKHTLMPNLVQTTEHVPAFVHIGPFANIAHGTNSIIADRIGLKLVDYFVTETGFGSDLGFEKFVNVITRVSGLQINLAVVVASVRALKVHGHVKKANLQTENIDAIVRGFENLKKHIHIVQNFGIPLVVAINRFSTDTEAELKMVEKLLESINIPYALNTCYTDGGAGAIELAKKVITEIDRTPKPVINYTYELTDSLKLKIQKIATKIYGADEVVYTKEALKDLKLLETLKFDKFHVIMAKTQSSLSDNPKLRGAPSNFKITVHGIHVLAGAKFVVPMLGEILTMPGLPKEPAALKIGLTDNGEITGLF